MSNSLPNQMASLNLNNIPSTSALAEAGEDWLTFNQISAASRGSAIKVDYRAQLRELWGLVANAAERSVEQFVLMEEMEALTAAFDDAVTAAKTKKVSTKKKEAREKEVVKVEAAGEDAGGSVMGAWKGGESAEKWRQFRSGDGKI